MTVATPFPPAGPAAWFDAGRGVTIDRGDAGDAPVLVASATPRILLGGGRGAGSRRSIAIGEGPLTLRPPAATPYRLVPREALPRDSETPATTGRIADALARVAAAPCPPRVRELADELGLSERHLGRAVRALLGISTKGYLRLVRFDAALRLAHGLVSPDWADLAAECGYCDQTHLIRDFRQFSGLTPCRWHEARSRLHPWIVDPALAKRSARGARPLPTPAFA